MSSTHRDIPGGDMPAPPHFVCWGEVLWDIFPDRRMLGGAPANVAYHLAALGERVSLISRVGDDARGHEARAALADAGVDAGTVQIDRARPTGWVEVAFPDPDVGEPRYRLVPDCAWEHIEVDEAAARVLGQAAAFCYGTLSQRASTRWFDRAIDRLPADCLRVCDVNLRPKHLEFAIVQAALEAADVVKINEDEAEDLAKHAGVADACAWLLSDMGVQVVALTRGPAGCVLMSGTEIADHPGFPAGVGGDNVGAGDGFTAVLARMLVADRSLEDIAEAGNRYGAYIAARRGATPVIDDELLEWLSTEP